MLHRTHAHRGLERERRAGIRAMLFTRQYSQRNIAVQCKCHRSALHRPSQHAASALAAHCTRHTGRLPYSPHPLSRDCATSLPPPATKLPNHFQTLPPLPLSHFKPTPLSLPDSPHHPSPSAQSPPSSPPACVRLPTRNCRFTYPPLPSSIPKTTTRLPYPAPRPATAHKKTAPNPVKIVL